MSEDKTQVTASPAVTIKAIIENAATLAATNLPIIAEKVANVKTFGSYVVVKPGEEYIDEATDKYANELLVKAGVAETDIVKMRMAISKPMDNFKKEIMIFEKELQEEIGRIREMRNARANAIAAKAKAAEDEINKKKKYLQYEAEIKSKMKVSLESGIADRVFELDNALAKLVDCLTIQTRSAIEKQIAGFKPSLKKEYFESLLDVEYDAAQMTAEQFADVKARALTYWKHDEMNAAYCKECGAVVDKWRKAIPGKILELKQIASGGPAAEALAKNAAAIATQNAEERKAAHESGKQKISVEAEAEKQTEVLNTEFDAQVKLSGVEQQEGGRKKVTYRIDPKIEKDFIQVAAMLGKIALHMLAEKDSKGIFVRDKQGHYKRDDRGQTIYVDGVSYWLNELASLQYTPDIPGLIKTEEVITIAKSK